MLDQWRYQRSAIIRGQDLAAPADKATSGSISFLEGKATVSKRIEKGDIIMRIPGNKSLTVEHALSEPDIGRYP